MGTVILETSKLHMYKFWYDYLKVKYGDKVKLLYTDTDSFVLEILTDDVYEDMQNDNHLLDFSEYPKDHKCYDVKNKKVYGIFKCELKGKIMTEFCCLKAKIYSFEYIKKFTFKDNKKCKENKITKDRIKIKINTKELKNLLVYIITIIKMSL